MVKALKSWIGRFATYLGEIYIAILNCKVAAVAATEAAAEIATAAAPIKRSSKSNSNSRTGFCFCTTATA